MSLLAYSGILNAFFIPSAILFLWLQNERFSFFNTPISYTRKTRTKTQFIAYTLSANFIEIAFLISIFQTFPSLLSPNLLWLLILGLGSLAVTAVTTKQEHSSLHKIAGHTMATTVILWSILFHIELLSVSVFFGFIGLLLSLLCVTLLPFIYFHLKSVGWAELLFAGIVICWNIMMTVLLFNLL